MAEMVISECLFLYFFDKFIKIRILSREEVVNRM